MGGGGELITGLKKVFQNKVYITVLIKIYNILNSIEPKRRKKSNSFQYMLEVVLISGCQFCLQVDGPRN